MEPGPAHEDVQHSLTEIDRLVATIEADSTKLLFGGTDLGFDEADVGRSEDGTCRITVSPDKMVAVADFTPPVGLGRPLTVERYRSQLADLGVVRGLVGDPAVLSGQRVVVARGTPPISEAGPRLEVEEPLQKARRFLDNEGGALDFKTESAFVQVHAGDLLAHLIPARTGEEGVTVEGKALPFARDPTTGPRPGRNVSLSEANYRASCDGSFRFEGGQFWVDRILILESGVGYHTGHIDFDGDVKVLGEIAAGFNLRVRGSLHSTQPIDVTEIVCGGEVVTPGGVIGRPGSSVRAGGRLLARFLENTWVMAHGPVEVRTSVLNCHLQTLDRLVMGPRGVLLGGRVEARNGVDVYQIGNSHGAKVQVACGMDFTVVEKQEWARSQSLSLVKQLRTLETHRAAHPEQETALAAACGKARDQILKLNEMSRRLVSRIDANDQAMVAVRGTVFPGTSIEICHAFHQVLTPRTRVGFVLDKALGAIREVRL